MPRNGTGSYALPNPDVLTGTPISSADYNATLADLATAMTNSLARNGEAGMVGNLPMGANRVTGMAAPAADADAARRRDVGSEWLATIEPTGTPIYVEFEFPLAMSALDVDLVSVRPAADAVLFFQVSNNAGGSWYGGATDYRGGSSSSAGTASGSTASAGALSFNVLRSAGFLNGRVQFSRSGVTARPVGWTSTIVGPRVGATWDGGVYFGVGPFDGVANRLRMFWLGTLWSNEGRVIVRGVRS